MPGALGSESLLSFVHTGQANTHVELVLLSVLLPGSSEPTDRSDLAETLSKGGQMSKSCCLPTLQLSLRKLGGGGGCAKEASPLPSVCAGGCNALCKWCKPTWGSPETRDLLNSIANKTVCCTHSQGRGFCNPHLTGIPACVLLTTPRRSFIQMKRVAQAQHLLLFPHRVYYAQGGNLSFRMLQHSQIFPSYPLEAFPLLLPKTTRNNPPL